MTDGIIKEKDFVEIEYTGKIKADNTIFDTTDEALAKKEQIHDKGAQYGAKVICVGQGQILQGIDKFIIGKKLGKYELDIIPEDAFGRKDPKQLKIVPTNAFTKEDIKPFPGLQVSVDGSIGLIKAVSGGRTIVDFNHPLSGHELHYEINVKKIVTDEHEKVKSILKLMFREKGPKFEIKDGIVEMEVKTDVPKEISAIFAGKIKELVPSIKDVSFKKV